MAKDDIQRITLDDAERIRTLACENDGNPDLNRENIDYWYFQNPHRSSSLWKVNYDSNVEGYATTNNFYYHINGDKKLIAFPQNVLTSNKVRGKGLFKKLYYKTEEENLRTNGVDFFLTFTGDMSTPIFLNKFGYKKGQAPHIRVLFFSPVKLLKKADYRVIKDVSEIKFDRPIYQFKNGRIKELDYFLWRYKNVTPGRLVILEVRDHDHITGYAFLIKDKKKGVPVLILADVISEDENGISRIIRSCKTYASKNVYVALFMFDLEIGNIRGLIDFKINQSSTFLVKGKSDSETNALSETKFDMFFGDLDYLW